MAMHGSASINVWNDSADEIAISEIEKCAGTQFDPNLAKMFVEVQNEILEAKNNPEEYYKKYSYIYKNSKFI